MSRCTIERELSAPSEALEGAKREAAKYGSRFEGDTERGTYVLRTPLGPITGVYLVDGTTVRFEVQKKPAIVPCRMIEGILDQLLRRWR